MTAPLKRVYTSLEFVTYDPENIKRTLAKPLGVPHIVSVQDSSDSMALLRIAAWVPGTRALGPGLRFALWLQGCCFSCSGCVAPGFIPEEGGSLLGVDALLEECIRCGAIDGITISGGEPMLQAEALAAFLQQLRARVTQSVILYSGFTLQELERLAGKRPAIRDVLDRTDVLIDGRYRHPLNDSRGLRGSSNQVIWFLSTRHRDERELFEKAPRAPLERHAAPDGLMIVGVPTLAAWRKAALHPTGPAILGDTD